MVRCAIVRLKTLNSVIYYATAIFEGNTQDEGINPANAVSAGDGLLATTSGEIGVVLHTKSYS